MHTNESKLWALIFLTLTLILADQSRGAEGPSLLIENVRITSSEGQADPDLTHIRIRDGVLSLVSEDHIKADEAATVLDAGGGYLLGNLQVGARPKFMILDEDPAADVMVLGVGCTLFCDEGFGVRVVEKLEQMYDFPDTVILVDGGVLGVNLLGVISKPTRTPITPCSSCRKRQRVSSHFSSTSPTSLRIGRCTPKIRTLSNTVANTAN